VTQRKRRGLIAAACLSYLLADVVLAQTPAVATKPPATTAPAGSAADIEPGVNTSAGALPTPAPAAGKPASTSSRPTPPRRGPLSPGRANADRIDLDNTQITGNRELPKVLYIVPWKRPELGDLVGRPLNSLLDEVLAPVDRDVFRRENRYFNALQNGSGSAAPPPVTTAPAAPEGPGAGPAANVPPSTPAPKPPNQPES
jgi:hypothetical protein